MFQVYWWKLDPLYILFLQKCFAKKTKARLTIAGLIAKLERTEGELSQLQLYLQENHVTFIDSADIHKSFDGVFSEPTVFTTWTFTIPHDRNPGLNLDGLYEIELKFSGSFVTASPSVIFVRWKPTDEDIKNRDKNTQDAKNVLETDESGDDKDVDEWKLCYINFNENIVLQDL